MRHAPAPTAPTPAYWHPATRDSQSIVDSNPTDTRNTVHHVALRFPLSSSDTAERDNPARRANTEIVIAFSLSPSRILSSIASYSPSTSASDITAASSLSDRTPEAIATRFPPPPPAASPSRCDLPRVI